MQSLSFQDKLSNLANVTLEIGLNLQKEQTLFINADLEAAPLVRKVAGRAYEKGAKHVHVNWIDQEIIKQKILHAPEESLSEFPEWMKVRSVKVVEDKAGFLSIRSTVPEAFAGLDSKRVNRYMKSSVLENQPIATARKSGKISYCVVCVPNKEWAQRVYPECSPDDAFERLWESIFEMTRVDQEDPIDNWNNHIRTLLTKVEELNEQRFRQLHIEAPGTDLLIDLPDNHLWVGGGATTNDGTFFTPNLPTEEVFTAPQKYGVNGTVSSTMPLIYGGSSIEDIKLTFESGKIIEASASKGLETLKGLLDNDEGSRFLGEVALVPQDSPIAKRNTIFYNTLFDENASCHLAIGAAYPLCVEGGTMMTTEDLEQAGLNTSIVHVDFMIGSNEMTIDGIRIDGHREPLFQNGCWVKQN